MGFQVLISTMNPNPERFMGYGFSTLVISQNSTEKEVREENFTFLSFDEIGLSKSRNKALDNATKDIALISDDDLIYCEGFENKIQAAFDQFPDADILTFKIITPEGKPYKNYSSESFKHDRSSIYKVSSVEIVVRIKSLKDAGVKFDENFGLGSKFPSGEETIFLNDAISKGLNLYFVPEYIVCHPLESSGKILDEKYFRSKGALIKRLYGNSLFLGLGFAFLFKQFLKSSRTISLRDSIKESLKGFNSIQNF